eukprot:UN22353
MNITFRLKIRQNYHVRSQIITYVMFIDDLRSRIDVCEQVYNIVTEF